jgi:hypothetical protein
LAPPYPPFEKGGAKICIRICFFLDRRFWIHLFQKVEPKYVLGFVSFYIEGFGSTFFKRWMNKIEIK